MKLLRFAHLSRVAHPFRFVRADIFRSEIRSIIVIGQVCGWSKLTQMPKYACRCFCRDIILPCQDMILPCVTMYASLE